MKRATQHSGRSHRTNPQGEKKAYSDFHLDRNFTTQADNIDKTRTPQNVVWNWYDKFETKEDGSPLHSFSDVELVFYQERYQKQLEVTNEKYKASRHKERVKTMEQWKKQVKHAPEEVINQRGDIDDHPDVETLKTCWLEYFQELQNWSAEHSNVLHILDWALHQDELGAPHVHHRRVWDYYNPETQQFEIGQEKALKYAGVPLPHPEQAPGRFNNRKMTFDAEMRKRWIEIIQKHGIEIETEPLPKNKVGMSLDQKIRQKEEERRQKEIEAEQILKEAEEKKKALEKEKESFKTEKELFENEKNDFKTEKESLENEKEKFELFRKTENDSIEKSKAELAEKTKEAQKILNRESSVSTREESVTQRETDVDRREKEQAEWIEKQKKAHEYLKAHDIDSNYFVLDTEIPELLEPEDTIFTSEKRSDYTIRNLKNFKKIVDEKIDHFKRKFTSLVNCVKTLLEENKILRKENKSLKEDFDKTVSAKVTVAENKLRFDLTKKHLEEKAELQKKADRWDNFMKGKKTTFVFNGVNYTCETGAGTIYNVFNELTDYESMTQYGVEMLAKKMKAHGFETVKEAHDYAKKHNLKSITDISEKAQSQDFDRTM